MDFVISKVLMSICALMVVSIIGGMIGSDVFTSSNSELSDIVEEFLGSVKTTVMSGSGSRINWRVPNLPSGESVELSFHCNYVQCASERGTYATSTIVALHFWIWDEVPLNETKLASLNDEAGTLRTVSGDELLICCERVLYDNEFRNLIFVRSAL